MILWETEKKMLQIDNQFEYDGKINKKVSLLVERDI